MISTTVTPVLCNSLLIPSVREVIADLDIEYIVVPGAVKTDATLDTFIIRPFHRLKTFIKT
jgi:hypothetical protein